MGTITATDLPESFSFSCYEFNSSIFDDEEDDKESYIEINFQTTQDSKEFEFRISLSSIPPIEFSGQCLTDQLHHEGQILPFLGWDISSTASDKETQIPSSGRSAANDAMANSTVEISRFGKVFKRRLPGVNRKVKVCEPVNGREQEDGHGEFIGRSRKPSKIVTAFSNGVMKFFIKLRSGNILSTFMSLIKSYHSFSHHSSNGSQTIRIYGRLPNMFHRWWLQINNINVTRRKNNSSSSINNNVDEDENLSIKFKELEVKSSPRSINSSPARRGFLNERMSSAEREHSVRAAIDHCKKIAARRP
ncbi:hypothetical protein MRB53_000869 [Persea americana]|uniref:Uncharacterized protein n=1 Tax=Persea americana TaxID=3435 RepID=A0ACC2MQ14_PERAE|nr:hypothetical protein MRB53_000869 [Persea americana]